jgi:AcrR family transcriptional regulator
MPKVLPEYLELRRQQILDAAAACFGRKGFHQSTMQDICEHASLSPGAVYRYFRSKEEIIEAMCAHGQSQNAELIQAAVTEGGTLPALNELIRIFFLEQDNLHSTEICALNVELIAEAMRNETVRDYLSRNNATVREQFAAMMRSAQAQGEVNSNLDPDAVARVMIALYQGFITQKLVDPDLDPQSYGQVLQALFSGTFWQQAAPSSERPAAAALRH